MKIAELETKLNNIPEATSVTKKDKKHRDKKSKKSSRSALSKAAASAETSTVVQVVTEKPKDRRFTKVSFSNPLKLPKRILLHQLL